MTTRELVQASARSKALFRALQLADAHESLSAFCGAIEIPGAPIGGDDEGEDFVPIREPQAVHHTVLLKLLAEVEAGAVRRAMIFMPPGSAKSTYASVIFPVWFMGRKRRRNVIVATYASELARKIGRRARSIVRQPVFEDIFGTGLSNESSAADEWAMTNGNEWMGGGILSGITGNRCDLLCIDDPVKGRQEADSETIRKRTKAEYEDSLKTRLKPGGRIVLIQTRWHEDDLAGGILPENYDGESGDILCRDGETWRVLCIPAEAGVDDPLGRQPGEMLWPEWFDAAHWRTFRSAGRTWSALYQQRPQPDAGTYFRREWFNGGEIDGRVYQNARFRPHQIPHVMKYGTSDYAVTEDGGDATVLRIWGVDASGELWLLDGWKGRTTSDVWIERQLDLVEKHKPMAWFGEAGVIQKSIEPMLRRRMRERRLPFRVVWLPSIADKPTRARGFQSRAACGWVHIPEGPIGDEILDEYLRFPAGRHDDDVDNGSLIGRALDDLLAAVPPKNTAPSGPPRGITQMTMDEVLKAQRPRTEGRI